MRQRFKPVLKGQVTITIGDEQYVYHNEILPPAYQIVASRLANIPSSNIDSIKVYNDGLLKASKSIQTTELIAPTEVQFLAVFDVADFSGDIDEVQLWCEALGAFSKLIGFTQNKPVDAALAILWKITVIQP